METVAILVGGGPAPGINGVIASATIEAINSGLHVIGIYDGGKKGTLTHELAHALFFIDDDYRQAVREAMRGYDTSMLEGKLLKAGYARHVIPDEVQAYIVAPSGKLGAASRALAPLRRKLRALFREHAAGFSIPKIS